MHAVTQEAWMVFHNRIYECVVSTIVSFLLKVSHRVIGFVRPSKLMLWFQTQRRPSLRFLNAQHSQFSCHLRHGHVRPNEAVIPKWTLQNPCFILISMSLKWRTIAIILSLMRNQIHDVYILRLVPNLDNHRSPFTLNKMLPDLYERRSWWLCDYSWT